MFLLILHQRFH